jgi:hypothetical protein
MKEKKTVIIVAEEHPPNLRFFAYLVLHLARREIEQYSESLIKTFAKTFMDRIKDAVRTMESSADIYLRQQSIKLKEYEMLDFLLSRLPRDSTMLYVEGSRGVLEERPEIDCLIKKYGIRVVLLDEGNRRYEKLEDERGNPLKNSSEIQIGREDYWVNKINTTMGDSKCAIVMVGRNHIRFSDKSIRRTSYTNSKEVGYLGKKLEELGYEVEIIDVIKLLPMDSKA